VCDNKRESVCVCVVGTATDGIGESERCVCGGGGVCRGVVGRLE